MTALNSAVLDWTARVQRNSTVLVSLSTGISTKPLFAPHTGIRSKYNQHYRNFSNSQVHGTSYPGYLHDLTQTRFAWAPPGRGIDTHRAWECLLLGCIPIVIKSPLSSVYAGLPVLEVDDYAAVTASMLRNEWGRHWEASPDWRFLPEMFGFYWLLRFEDTAAAAA